MEDVVAQRFAVLPSQDVRAEAVVGKAFCWVRKGVFRKFEVDVDGLGVGQRGGDLIGMELEGSGTDISTLERR